jgi:hypothetical protein
MPGGMPGVGTLRSSLFHHMSRAKENGFVVSPHYFVGLDFLTNDAQGVRSRDQILRSALPDFESSESGFVASAIS